MVFCRCAVRAKDYWRRLRHVLDDDPLPTPVRREAPGRVLAVAAGGAERGAPHPRRVRSPCGDRQTPAAAPPAPLPPSRTPPPSPTRRPRATPSSISTMPTFVLLAAPSRRPGRGD